MVLFTHDGLRLSPGMLDKRLYVLAADSEIVKGWCWCICGWLSGETHSRNWLLFVSKVEKKRVD